MVLPELSRDDELLPHRRGAEYRAAHRSDDIRWFARKPHGRARLSSSHTPRAVDPRRPIFLLDIAIAADRMIKPLYPLYRSPRPITCRSQGRVCNRAVHRNPPQPMDCGLWTSQAWRLQPRAPSSHLASFMTASISTALHHQSIDQRTPTAQRLPC